MPNGPEKKLNFVPKIYDTVAKAWKPFYIPPDATDKVQGDVKLSDATDSSLNAATGMTAASPAAVNQLRQDLTETIEDVESTLQNNKLDKVQVEAQTVKSQVTFQGLVTGDNGFKGNLDGNAATTTKLKTPRSISVKSGSQPAVSAEFDGSADIALTLGAIDATNLVGQVPLASIPQGALERVVSYETLDAAVSAYTSAATGSKPFSEGDTIRVTSTDPNIMYAVIGDPSNKSNYVEYSAGSAMSAVEAEKLSVGTIGSTTVPVYFNSGVPKVITTLGMANGGTGATTVPNIANNLKYSSIGDRTEIPASSNLDTYTTTGSYCCSTTANAKTITNTPNGNSSAAFILDVIASVGAGSTYRRQRLSYYNDFDVWERIYDSSASTKWSPWRRTSLEENSSADIGATIKPDDLDANTIPSNHLKDGDSNSESDKIFTTTSSSSSGTTESAINIPIGKITLGAYSIIARMKTSSITTSTFPALSIGVRYSGTSLKSANIFPDSFSQQNKWECLSFGVNIDGAKDQECSISIQPLNGANVTIDLDYIRIIPSGTALGSIG